MSHGVEELRLIDKSVNDFFIFSLPLKSPEHAVPDDQNSSVVLVLCFVGKGRHMHIFLIFYEYQTHFILLQFRTNIGYIGGWQRCLNVSTAKFLTVNLKNLFLLFLLVIFWYVLENDSVFSLQI